MIKFRGKLTSNDWCLKQDKHCSFLLLISLPLWQHGLDYFLPLCSVMVNFLVCFMVCFSVQKAAIPPLLEGKDVFVKSKTGTGAS